MGKPRLMPSHGWLTLTADMLDTHTLPPMVLMLTHPLSTPMPLMPPQSPPMLELTSLAREKLKPNQNPGMELTDTPVHTDTPPTEPTEDTLLTVHTPTDVYMEDTDTDGEHLKSKLVTFYLLNT